MFVAMWTHAQWARTFLGSVAYEVITNLDSRFCFLRPVSGLGLLAGQFLGRNWERAHAPLLVRHVGSEVQILGLGRRRGADTKVPVMSGWCDLDPAKLATTAFALFERYRSASCNLGARRSS